MLFCAAVSNVQLNHGGMKKVRERKPVVYSIKYTPRLEVTHNPHCSDPIIILVHCGDNGKPGALFFSGIRRCYTLAGS